ncbi:DNA-processing protein DprA [Saccharibacillus sp. JS10]|uniref:DNA-processing protein DprA n=1 Tax=Saccharibacillus sp. JS10 TaxID=2950552 RepID=UPI0021088578|nr:DNA-processing protein DprA [Saccharibacillus sp. JS10]MCQ4085946.1 DNA-processing protein DprA [Saccharibacillus sp. JS10]
MEKLSDESLSILLLTSDLLYRKTKDKEQKPFTPSEWNKFASLLRNSSYATPGSLYDKNEDDLIKELLISKPLAKRVCTLMKYAAVMAIEVEKLSGMGIWIATRGDRNYPQRVKQLLKEQSPPFFYGAGDGEVLRSSAVGFVGSRDADSKSIEFTKRTVRKVIDEGASIVSGGAKGIDLTSQNEALSYGGKVVAFVHSELDILLRKKEMRKSIVEGQLVLLSAVHPSATFKGFNAMARNKYIYTHSRGTVVAASGTKGGTWEGANENLKHSWVPLIVRDSENIPEGNRKLLEMGAFNRLVIPYSDESHHSIIDLLKNSTTVETKMQVKQAPKKDMDLFYTVWPTIQTLTKQNYSFSELCQILNILPSQLESWLERGNQKVADDEERLLEQPSLF